MEYKDCIEFWKCAKMFEHLHAQSLGQQTVYLKGSDHDYWMKNFYPAYVKTGLISDTKFYCENADSHLGVGNDAAYVNHEYCNILYQLYKHLAKFNIENVLRSIPEEIDLNFIEGWPKFLIDELNSTKDLKDPVKLLYTLLTQAEWPADPLLTGALQGILLLKGYVKQYKYNPAQHRAARSMSESFELNAEEKDNWISVEPVMQFIINMDATTNEAFLIKQQDKINGSKLLYTLSKLYKYAAAAIAAQPLNGGFLHD